MEDKKKVLEIHGLEYFYKTIKNNFQSKGNYLTSEKLRDIINNIKPSGSSSKVFIFNLDASKLEGEKLQQIDKVTNSTEELKNFKEDYLKNSKEYSIYTSIKLSGKTILLELSTITQYDNYILFEGSYRYNDDKYLIKIDLQFQSNSANVIIVYDSIDELLIKGAPIIRHESGDVSITPNTYNILPDDLLEINVDLEDYSGVDDSSKQYLDEYMFEFKTGDTIPMVSWPVNILLANLDELERQTRYQVSIVRGVGLIAGGRL